MTAFTPFLVVDKEFPDQDKTTRHCPIMHFDKFESILRCNQAASFLGIKFKINVTRRKIPFNNAIIF